MKPRTNKSENYDKQERKVRPTRLKSNIDKIEKCDKQEIKMRQKNGRVWKTKAKMKTKIVKSMTNKIEKKEK